jgi:hypothetical protein
MIKIEFKRKKLILAIAMLPFLLLSAQAFGQNAGVSGTVTDASGAVLPGATITAISGETGVKSATTTNNAGVYNFASLPTGTYSVSAEMPGFQTLKKTDVKLVVGSQLRVSFEMQVSTRQDTIEVTTSVADMLLEATSTTGTIMDDKVAKELPLVANDVMQLVNVMGGVVKAENTIFGNSDQTFAGIRADAINITRDGISVNDARYSSGIVTPSRLNPEMVGEFKLILTPVDAEMGRGSGQVQILTKSGGNEYHGSGVWSNINTALDANEWNANRTGTQAMWKNVNQYTISGGGPIIKNKTFFFASWDQNIVRKREQVTATSVLTPCARKGIYRYWSGFIPGNADLAAPSFTAGAQTIASVDANGIPVRPNIAPSGSGAYAGPQTVSYGSVLGQLSAAAKAQIDADPINCSQYNFGGGSTGVVANTAWDKYRKTYDTTGYVDRFSKMMPLPNYYRTGDGLNTAALRWTRTTHGEDTVYGSGMDSARKSITAKIDHNIGSKHRLSGTYSFEKDLSDGENEPTWPSSSNGFGGAINRQPQTFTATFTSTLKPTLLNEFRFGLAYNMNQTMGAIDNPTTGEALKAEMQKYVDTSNWAAWKGLPVLIAPAGFAPNVSNFMGGRTAPPSTWGGRDWRWNYADTLSWTKGSHAFKIGGDIRLTKTQSFLTGSFDATANSWNWWPYVTGGDTTYATPSGLLAGGGFPGIVGLDNVGFSSASGSVTAAYSLLNYMVGSITSVKQFYFAKDTKATDWSDPATAAGQMRWIRTRQREFDVFFKDDWKIHNNLTLNLGIRWEYYGVPWNLDGMTIGVVGGAQNLFGGQSGGFDQWLRGTPAFDTNKVTTQHFIGPGSANPSESLFNKDRNNFGPAVGFAWQLPWFGKGKTTIRGGYQVSYLQIGRAWDASATQPGTQWRDTFSGDAQKMPYMDLATLQNAIPTSKWWDGSVKVLGVRPLNGKQDADASVWDPNVRNPYIQSLTMAISRQIGSSLTVDVRYIGTLSRKQMGSINLNTNNWLKNGLKEAFDIARAGGESALLNQLIPPGSLAGGAPGASGAAQLRQSYFTSTALANGNYNSIASTLATSNGTTYAPNSYGELARKSGLGPNFIKTNTQFGSATWNANLNNSQYHSMQAQITMRPTHGFNFVATYTWSKNLGIRGDGTDPLNRHADYGILGSDRSHALTTYGTFNLPLGSSGFAFRNSSGWVKELVEGWQLSWVSSMSSGLPYSAGAGAATMFGGSALDLVDPSLFDPKGGHVSWDPGARGGYYFGNGQYTAVTDPSCSSIAPSLQFTCSMNLKALAVASGPNAGKIVLQQATPGRRGTFDPNSLVGPGRWSLDMAISKNFRIMEGKFINFRIDVNNIFNHPAPSGSAPFSYDQRTYAPGNPISSLTDVSNGANSFGYLGYKVGHRVFSAKVRVTF